MLTSHELLGFMSPSLALDILTYAYETDKPLYRATLGAVAEARKLRPVFLERQPRPQRHAAMLATLARPSLDMVTANLLRTWLLKKHKQMLTDFLDALGIVHQEGVVEDLPPAMDDAKVRAAVDGSPIDMYKRTRAEGFGSEVKRRIILGTYVLSSGYYDAYYLRAQKVRTLIRRDFEAAFERCDALLTPVTPTPAYRLGETMDDPLHMYLGDIFTVTANLAGICGLAVPCGRTAAGLPVGMQVLGPAFGEEKVIRVGGAYERSVGQ